MVLLLFGCNTNNHETVSQPQNDSIKKYLDLASNDTIPFKMRDAYNQKAFSFIDLSKNDTLVRWYLFVGCINYSRTKNNEGLAKTRKNYIKIFSKTSDNLTLAMLYRINGAFFKNKREFDSAYYYYEKAIKSYKKTTDIVGLGEVYYRKSWVQNNISDYLGAELSLKQALILFKKKKMYYRMYSVLNELGNIYNSLKEYKTAIKCHEEALNLVVKYNLKSSIQNNLIGTSLNNIGNAYREKGDYYKAIFYFKMALNNEMKFHKDDLLVAYIYENLSCCYIKLNKYDIILEMLKKSDSIFKKDKIYKEAAIVNMYLSQYYFKKKKYVKAKEFSNKALNLGKKSGEYYYYLTILSNAGYTDLENAPIYLEQYHKLSDSLIYSERKKRSQFYKIQLETNEISKEKEKAVKLKWAISSTIAVILIIVILLFVIYRQKAKQNEMQLLQDQKNANEEIYKLLLGQHAKEEEVRQNEKRRIALELHDNVMNQLASTRFNLYAISQNTDKDTIEKALHHIDKIKDIENEIRSITHNLSTDVFEETNTFEVLLEKLVEEQNKTYPAQFQLEMDPKIAWEAVSGKIKINLYRILQEIIHNTNKHAQATYANINIVLDYHCIGIAVQDNGIGFVESQTDGIGLKNIHNRLKEIEGNINIKSELGVGTSIFITIPI